jgi:uncharacterized protein YgiM (DUF1202 family)
MSKSLSVRQEASAKGRILAAVKQDEIYEVIQKVLNEEGIWYKIRLDGDVEGWVQHAHVKLQE